MNQTANGGARPPSEPERSLNEMLDGDLCEAINQVEAFDLGPSTDPRTDRRRSLGDNLLIGLIVGAFFFGMGVWLDSNKEAVAHPANAPEVTIGVDPNE